VRYDSLRGLQLGSGKTKKPSVNSFNCSKTISIFVLEKPHHLNLEEHELSKLLLGQVPTAVLSAPLDTTLMSLPIPTNRDYLIYLPGL